MTDTTLSRIYHNPNPPRLTDYDIPRIGHTIGIDEDRVHMLLEVESRGRGFDKNNNVIMLFEPHILYRHLNDKDRVVAVQRGLARPKWKRDYPANSYLRFEEACKINKTAAFMACSWGLGQIMGFNHKLAGYNNAIEMVRDFRKGEAQQLQGMINFIKNTKLDDELRDLDYHGFARGYNGSGYRKNNYHVRLEKAYRKWSKIKDTPWSPEMAEQEEIEAEAENIISSPKANEQREHWIIRLLRLIG